MTGDNTELSDILAAECGGTPEDYEADLRDMPSLDEAAASTKGIDMSPDNVPVEFEDIDLDEAEEIRTPSTQDASGF